MNLVLNASPLIFLVKIGLIAKLPEIVDQLFIPEGVISEIAKYKDEAFEWVSKEAEKYSVKVAYVPKMIAAWDLGRGESEVITFAYQNKNMTVAIDDKAARNCARSLQIQLTGTIGLIILAKRKNLISDVEPYLTKLIESGYRISPLLFKQAIELGTNS
jgi:predicted nucleic acid-binding protein